MSMYGDTPCEICGAHTDYCIIQYGATVHCGVPCTRIRGNNDETVRELKAEADIMLQIRSENEQK
jgi:delta-aminolevulinic acid dehydratase/porphobilinogen synthase